jgi:hypothetical protein
MLAALCGVCCSRSSPQRPLRPLPAVLAGASPELLNRLKADPFTYFRFINRAWTERVCEVFADVTSPTVVRLHGDAHVEQFALTDEAWGLDDFDDSSRGPSYVDIVRFLGSIDLATRQRGWTRDRDELWGRFFEGYRRGLSDPAYRPAEPDIVRELRRQAPLTRAAYLAWGEQQMQPMEDAGLASVAAGMDGLDRLIRPDRPNLAPGYFAVRRAGWLRLGVGSASTRKMLIRVEGPTSDPDDDQLLEAKEVTNLEGVPCIEAPTTPLAVRVVDGTRQLGRLKHDILAVGPTMLMPAAGGRAEEWLDWWVSSWEPSYREIRLSDLRSARDLGDIAFDSGVQMGAGIPDSVRKPAWSSVTSLEARLRTESATMVEELLAGWREVAGR